jgi:anti-anti-sigma factor
VLELDHREVDSGVALITVTGRVMLGPESQQIETAVSELIAGGCRKFIFDLAGVTHIDSTGIGRFIAALNLVMKVRGSLFLTSAVGQVRESFRVTRLDTIFKFCDSVDAARAAAK